MSVDSYIGSGVLELYVAGVLTPEEMAAVEAMAAQHARVREELALIEESFRRYGAESAPRPAPDLFGRITDKINAIPEPAPAPPAPKSKAEARRAATQAAREKDKAADEPPVNRLKPAEAPVRRRSSGWGWAIAASLLLAGSAAGNYYLYTQWQESTNELAETRLEYSRMSQEYSTAKTTLSQAQSQLDIYRDPNYKAIRLKGQEIAPNAEAMVYWNRQSDKVYLKVHHLPQTPQGMQYQLWAIGEDEKPIDAGMVTAVKPDSGLSPMKPIVSAKAFAITLEPMGGSPAPTSQIYAMASL